ncbi:MAG TPA: kelch repeat-containing protein, partial [Ignavibacteriales bacterium]|nr:kelch repeat-containing protein [Ignavibacteriales bacterium]
MVGTQSYYDLSNSAKAYSETPGKVKSYVPGQYYVESFEGSVFPPAGWQAISIKGAEAWKQGSGYKGLFGAYISWAESGPDSTGVDWLIAPQYTAYSGDSLTFYVSPDDTGYVPDTLWVLASTVSEVPADSAALDAAFSDTLLVIAVDTLWGRWNKFSVSLEKYAGSQIYIGFKEFNKYGCGLLLDYVQFGPQPDNDLSISLLPMGPFVEGDSIAPAVRIENIGKLTQTFDVTVQVPAAGYGAMMSFTDITPDSSFIVMFTKYKVANGNQEMNASIASTTDENESNNVYTLPITPYKKLTSAQWRSETPMDAAMARHAAFSYVKKGVGEDPDESYIYAMGGNAYGVSDSIFSYNTDARQWSLVGHMPVALRDFSAFQINGKVYIPGGNEEGKGTGSASNLYIYDIEADTFLMGASMPVTLSAYASAVYGDSLIYLFGGIKDRSIPPFEQTFNEVFAYNINSNTWSSCTSLPDGGAYDFSGSIVENTIVLAGSSDKVYYGQIDPSNPNYIVWSTGKYPQGTATACAAGSWYGKDLKQIYFAGGSDLSPLKSVWAYDITKKEWFKGPDKITPTKYSSSLVPVVRGDSVFLAATGGSALLQPQNVNEWLYIGPNDALTAEGKDIAAYSIDADTAVVNMEFIPKAAFINKQLAMQSFNVTMEITPGGYSNTQTVTNLAYNNKAQVSFDKYIPLGTGTYTIKAYASLPGDENMSNDTLTSELVVLSSDVAADYVMVTPVLSVNKDVYPKAVVYNYSEFPQTFTVTMKIAPGDYSSVKTVENAAAWSPDTVAFDKWTPASLGEYEVQVYTTLASDMISSNDTVTVNLNVIEGLNTGEWFKEPEAPVYVLTKPSVFFTKKAKSEAEADSSYIFIVSTKYINLKKSAIIPEDSSYFYNVNTRTWKQAAQLPAKISNFSAAYAGGKVYVPAGAYPDSMNSCLFIYDIEANKWSKGAQLPMPVSDYVLGAYGDSLIYVVGGVHAGMDTTIYYNGVQIYNVKDNTWKNGTAFTGKFGFRHAGAILKNKIVAAGGRDTEIIYDNIITKNVSGKDSGSELAVASNYLDQVVIGVIDTLNPFNITWKTAPKYPAGAGYTYATAACETKDGSYVVFAGGRSYTWYSSFAQSAALAFDPAAEKWYNASEMSEPVYRGSGVSVVRNDSVYFAVIGGYSDNNDLGLNQWMYLGEA